MKGSGHSLYKHTISAFSWMESVVHKFRERREPDPGPKFQPRPPEYAADNVSTALERLISCLCTGTKG